MRIVEWLAPSLSAVNGIALVEVDAGEIADIEQMLILVDGDSVGHFGLEAKLVSQLEPPKIKPAMYGGKAIGMGHKDVDTQFGFSSASQLRKEKRYYKVFVHRD